MITASISNNSTSVDLPPIEQQFLDMPLENATDVTTLDGSMYTDFVNQKKEWVFNYDSLTEDQYNDIRAIYDSQYSTNDYPSLSIPYYSFNQACRMYINTKDIWNHCGDVQNVQLTFRQAS